MPDHGDTIGPQLSACLNRLSAGDLAARDTIIELCSDRLRTLASRMLSRFPNVRRWDDTDDVFQNAAMRLHRALGQMKLDSPRSIMALAATQLHRELIDLARRYSGPSSFAANHATNVAPPTDDGRSPQPSDGTQTPADALDRWSLFHDAIAGLPDQQREIFHLVWYLGADQKTIARLLDCSERTVKSRWREAREAVRTTLDGRSPE
ncbi:MAG: RNA polymerase sigma factor [Pirellulales bacterium]